jgi:hypothetical protein
MERRDKLDGLPVHLPRAPARHCLEAPSSKNNTTISLCIDFVKRNFRKAARVPHLRL